MTISSYFNNFYATNEQSLLENLVVESIKHYGMDMIYLPRNNEDYDPLYGSSDIVLFKDYYTVEMFIKSVDGFGGDGNFMSKFGLEIRDQVTLVVARKSFDISVGTTSNLKRPREGDLIYFPLNDKCFEIKFADDKPTFYQLGMLQSYNLTCELYEYSSEKFETGITAIDKLEKKYTQNVYKNLLLDVDDYMLTDQDGTILLIDTFEDDGVSQNVVDDSEIIQNQADDFLLFTEANPFGEGRI